MVAPLLNADHRGKVIFRMSVNPESIIRKVEIGTSSLSSRISALNAMGQAGYRTGLLIAPVILMDHYEKLYSELIDILASSLSEEVKRNGFIEIILMTYSYVQNQINTDAFPGAVPLFDKKIMIGRGMGKYCYKKEEAEKAKAFLLQQIHDKLKMPVLYVV